LEEGIVSLLAGMNLGEPGGDEVEYECEYECECDGKRSMDYAYSGVWRA